MMGYIEMKEGPSVTTNGMKFVVHLPAAAGDGYCLTAVGEKWIRERFEEWLARLKDGNWCDDAEDSDNDT